MEGDKKAEKALGDGNRPGRDSIALCDITQGRSPRPYLIASRLRRVDLAKEVSDSPIDIKETDYHG